MTVAGPAPSAVAAALPEAERNLLLRRADWRFLLGETSPRLSVCWAGPDLCSAVGAISEEVTVDPGDARPADLVVLENPSSAAINAAFGRLRPGGACYAEWSALPRRPAQVRQALAEAGFTDVTCWWAWPRRRAAEFWLPLEKEAAVEYILNRPQAPGRMLRRAAHLARCAAWRVLRRLGLLFPLSVTARRPAAGASAHGSSPLGWLESHWPEWGLGPEPSELSWLLLTGGPRSISKAVGLVFADGSRHPRLAIKMARVPEATAALAREAANVRAAQAWLPDNPGLPRAVFEERPGEVLMLGETAITGLPLTSVLRPGNFRALASKGTDWLIRFAAPAAAISSPKRISEPALEDFERSFGPLLRPSWLARTRQALDGLPELPVVFEQRDFSPWNVLLLGSGQLAVLDWESAEPNGLPLLDLIYFLSYLAMFRDGSLRSGRFLESYGRMLRPGSVTSAVFSECVTRYAQQVGIPEHSLPALRALAWIVHSRSDYRHLLADMGGSAPTTQALRKSTFLQLWEEEMRLWESHGD
jgi:hypothetical protein